MYALTGVTKTDRKGRQPVTAITQGTWQPATRFASRRQIRLSWLPQPRHSYVVVATTTTNGPGGAGQRPGGPMAGRANGRAGYQSLATSTPATVRLPRRSTRYRP